MDKNPNHYRSYLVTLNLTFGNNLQFIIKMQVNAEEVRWSAGVNIKNGV